MRRVLMGLALGAAIAVAGCADGATSHGLETPGECQGPATATKAAAAAFALADFQPRSCGYGEVYGIERFRGRGTLVALLAGW